MRVRGIRVGVHASAAVAGAALAWQFDRVLSEAATVGGPTAWMGVTGLRWGAALACAVLVLGGGLLAGVADARAALARGLPVQRVVLWMLGPKVVRARGPGRVEARVRLNRPLVALVLASAWGLVAAGAGELALGQPLGVVAVVAGLAGWAHLGLAALLVVEIVVGGLLGRRRQAVTGVHAPATHAPPARRRLATAVVATVLLTGAAGIPFPRVVETPGEAWPLASGLRVAGRSADLHGEYLFLTAHLTPATLAQLGYAMTQPHSRVLPTADFVRPGERTSGYFRRQRTVFASTIDVAAAVGLQAAGLDFDPEAIAAGQQSPPAIDVEHGNVGGPSAGLMIALAVFDHASTEDLAAGRLIAGTGAISADGTVGSVGSTVAKIVTAQRAGATVYLVPAAQQRAARDAVAPGSPMHVIPVSTLEDAIEALRADASA